MFSRLIFILSILLFSAAPVLSQMGGQIRSSVSSTTRKDLHTPERGSEERKSIMDALRAPVEKKLHQSVTFKVDHVKVENGWAFMMGQPQRPDGTRVDYSNTVYKNAVAAGAFDDSVIALLSEVGGKWKVVQYVIGATDVPFVDWDKKYHTPKSIYPH